MTFTAIKTSFRKVIFPALLILCLALPGAPVDARRSKKAPAYNPPYAGFVMDAATGQILYSQNADKALRPASLTKIMTLLMVFEALERGELSLRDRVYISKTAASMSPSKLGVKAGSSITVKDAIYALVTKSCNDVAVAVAEKLGGSERNFGRMMTARARSLGMSRSVFVNASGLPSDAQFSSARDMAVLARYVITTYPSYYRYYSTKNFNFQGQNLHNHNRLMSSYPGMDGMKTGYVYKSGYNLVASAVRGDRRLIGVVFGGKTANSRNAQMAKLLDDGFARLRGQRTSPEPLLLVDNAPTLQDPILKDPILKNAPVPGRKPGLMMAAASLGNAAKKSAKAIPNLLTAPSEMPAGILTASAMNLEPAAGRIEQGGGDGFDAKAPRGQIIQAALTQPVAPVLTAPAQQQALPQQSSDLASWAVQVGAFSSRAATDKALSDSLKKLPVQYASVNPMIAPIKTQEGWVFRARLHGFSRADAFGACRYLSECVPVAPRNN